MVESDKEELLATEIAMDDPLALLGAVVNMIAASMEALCADVMNKHSHMMHLRAREMRAKTVRAYALKRALARVDGKNEDIRKMQLEIIEHDNWRMRVVNCVLDSTKDALSEADEVIALGKTNLSALKLVTLLAIEMAHLMHATQPPGPSSTDQVDLKEE